MKIENPSYYLKLNMENCPRIVAVNGIEIEQDFDGLANQSEYPINHFLKNGENHFELMVGDQDFMEESTDSSSRCQAEIIVKGSQDNENITYKITDIIYTPNYTGDSTSLYSGSSPSGSYQFNNKKYPTQSKQIDADFVVNDISVLTSYIEGGGEVFQRKFTAQLPFPEWAFFQGDEILKHPMDDDAFDYINKEMEPVVLQLWDTFESKDIEKILSLFENRSKEYDLAFYRKPGETLSQLRDSIESVFANNYPLNRKDWRYMQADVSYNGKLVLVTNAGTGNGTVMFYDKDSDSNTFYDVYWMKKDGKWIIAR